VPVSVQIEKVWINEPVVVETLLGVEHVNDKPEAVDPHAPGIHSEARYLLNKALEQPLACKLYNKDKTDI